MASTTVPVKSPSMQAALPSPTYLVLRKQHKILVLPDVCGCGQLFEVDCYLAAILCPSEAYKIIMSTRRPVQGGKLELGGMSPFTSGCTDACKC